LLLNWLEQLGFSILRSLVYYIDLVLNILSKFWKVSTFKAHGLGRYQERVKSAIHLIKTHALKLVLSALKGVRVNIDHPTVHACKISALQLHG
jgi:hypothetical protein